MSDPAKSSTIPVPDGHSHVQTQETEPHAAKVPELDGTGVNPPPPSDDLSTFWLSDDGFTVWMTRKTYRGDERVVPVFMVKPSLIAEARRIFGNAPMDEMLYVIRLNCLLALELAELRGPEA